MPTFYPIYFILLPVCLSIHAHIIVLNCLKVVAMRSLTSAFLSVCPKDKSSLLHEHRTLSETLTHILPFV